MPAWNFQGVVPKVQLQTALSAQLGLISLYMYIYVQNVPYFLEYKPGRYFLPGHRTPGLKTRPAFIKHLSVPTAKVPENDRLNWLLAASFDFSAVSVA